MVRSFEAHHISNLRRKKEEYGNVEGSVSRGIGIIECIKSKEVG